MTGDALLSLPAGHIPVRLVVYMSPLVCVADIIWILIRSVPGYGDLNAVFGVQIKKVAVFA
jgi:hypothetical protein